MAVAGVGRTGPPFLFSSPVAELGNSNRRDHFTPTIRGVHTNSPCVLVEWQARLLWIAFLL
jgi:hypothetical protein